jgi:hypothetical protein
MQKKEQRNAGKEEKSSNYKHRKRQQKRLRIITKQSRRFIVPVLHMTCMNFGSVGGMFSID